MTGVLDRGRAAAGGALPRDHLERSWAWGGASSAMSWVWRPTTVDGVREVFATARRHGRSVGLRGAGRSYGDAALNAENVCLDLSRMTRVLDWDPQGGLVRVEPGVTIRDLWRYTLEDGWWPPVVTGTMSITLGGGAGMNVHGKNNWKLGPLGDHVRAFELLLPSGEILRCSREQHADLFHAAIGGFGMLGCFTSIDLQLERVHSGLVEVEAVPATSFDEMFAVFDARLAAADYLVGWVDPFGRGPHAGRGLVHAAYHLAPGDDRMAAQTLRPEHQELPATLLGVVPKSIMWMFMRPFTNAPGVHLVNAAKYHLSRMQGRHRYRQSHVGFHFLLDYVPDWKRAYGPGGLIQFQSFVPVATARAVYGEIIERAHGAGLPPFLGVLKRHRPDDFLMTHANDGWSLALDFRVTAANRARLWRLCAELASVVTGGGGRFYFAKDSTLGPADVVAALGEERIARFRALKARCDPEGLLQTNLWRRLFATAASGPA